MLAERGTESTDPGAQGRDEEMQVEELRVTVQDVTQLELLDEQGEHEVSELFEVMCDITHRSHSRELALRWNDEEEMTVDKLQLGTFVQITEDDPVGYRKIRTRYVYDAMKQKARLVLQDIGKGATRPVDYVLDESLLATGSASCVLLSKWHTGIKRRFRDANPLPSRQVATRSELDPGVFYKGTPNGWPYCVVHVDNIIVLGALTERQRVMSALRDKYKLKHEWSCSQVGDRVGPGLNQPVIALTRKSKLQGTTRSLECSERGCWKDRPSLKAVKTAKRDEAEITMAAYADTDWGTCRESHRSFSGSVIMLMGAYVCGWTRKQVCVALSSADAKLIALTSGLIEDSEAVRCVALRAGVNPKVKHLGIRALHCQQVFKEGCARLHKVAGIANPADLFTKPVRAEVMHRLLPLLELERVGPGESENKGAPEGSEVEGRALAGVVVASLTTSAEGSNAITSILVDKASEECLVSTQVEYCSQEAVIQRAMERVQGRTRMMWVIGLS
eukprot:4024975-Amphidinium_carterae.5